MAKVRFTEGYTTKEPAPRRFEAGAVYDLPEKQADFWVGTGKAERAADTPKAADPEPKDADADPVKTEAAVVPRVPPKPKAK